MLNLTDDQFEALKKVLSLAPFSGYCVRGTAGLVMQGIDMDVDDIDLLSDEETSYKLDNALAEYAVERVSYKISDKFKSFYGKYYINAVQVEIMGNWQIFSPSSGWSRVYTGSNGKKINYKGITVCVTPPSLETEMFTFMERWNALRKILKQVQSSVDKEADAEVVLLQH